MEGHQSGSRKGRSVREAHVVSLCRLEGLRVSFSCQKGASGEGEAITRFCSRST